MTFVRRRIDVTISLGQGTFGDDKGPDVTLSGLRAKARIVTYNGDAQGQLQIRLYGMTEAMMNQLTILGPVTQERRNNSILVAAGDDGGIMSTAYQGTIVTAAAEYNGAPEVAFNVIALAAAIQAVKPVNASSYRGPADVATIMQTLATTMGFAFENNGVNAQLSNPYFSGTAYQQAKTCARAANIYFTVDRGTLAIWPKTTTRASQPVTISPGTGMVGYPVVSGDHIVVASIYQPDLQLGGRINVGSSSTVANGEWNIYSLIHDLESETPGGAWFSQVECYKMAPT